MEEDPNKLLRQFNQELKQTSPQMNDTHNNPFKEFYGSTKHILLEKMMDTSSNVRNTSSSLSIACTAPCLVI
jgi:ribosomal protein S17E